MDLAPTNGGGKHNGPSAALFRTADRSTSSPSDPLPDEGWTTILECPCTFAADIFDEVMSNLIENPNLTSSHLFRADVFYDSAADRSMNYASADPLDGGGFIKHLQPQFRPVTAAALPGCVLTRTIVRQLVPRNPQLDRPLVQSCHFFHRNDIHAEHAIVVYVPHEQDPASLPFYHPAVSQLAFVHTWPVDPLPSDERGTLSISYRLFPGTPLSTRLRRTGLRLLQTVHKHGQGRLAGYEKRVHLDRVIPQKRYQDTYARLKARHARWLVERWVEVTDPGKHVFEDIGIAAFLIELWRDMYGSSGGDATSSSSFPGFVDMGCGNGVLVYILLAEGYKGWGFDARQRKTWSVFPDSVCEKLQRRVLVPRIFQTQDRTASEGTEENEDERENENEDENEAASGTNGIWHDGIFPPGTFLISNHADELTAWTPLLARLSDSAFLAIPCCSHDLAGARFRAPAARIVTTAEKSPLRPDAAGLLSPSPLSPPQHPINPPDNHSQQPEGPDEAANQTVQPPFRKQNQAAETGSLARPTAQHLHHPRSDNPSEQQAGKNHESLPVRAPPPPQPSAYASLCAYVVRLAEELDFVVDTEVLRIPSTRNQSIIGRSRRGEGGDESKKSEARVRAMVEREVGRDVGVVGAEWVERVEKLMTKRGSGH